MISDVKQRASLFITTQSETPVLSSTSPPLISCWFTYLAQQGNASTPSEIMIKVNTVITPVLQTGQSHFKAILWISFRFFFLQSFHQRATVDGLSSEFYCLLACFTCSYVSYLPLAFVLFSNFNFGARTSYALQRSKLWPTAWCTHTHSLTFIWYKDRFRLYLLMVAIPEQTENEKKKKEIWWAANACISKSVFFIISSSYQDLFVLIPTFVSLLLSGLFWRISVICCVCTCVPTPPTFTLQRRQITLLAILHNVIGSWLFTFASNTNKSLSLDESKWAVGRYLNTWWRGQCFVEGHSTNSWACRG